MKHIYNKHDLEAEIQKTLNTKPDKLEVSPFFYAKLEQRMRAENEATQKTIWERMPVFTILLRPALLLVLMLGSIYGGILLGSQSTATTTVSESTFSAEDPDNYLNEVAIEYVLGNADMYDYDYVKVN